MNGISESSEPKNEVKSDETVNSIEAVLVQEILTARFLVLDDDDRLLLKIASHIGDYFWVELLNELSDKSSQNRCASLVQRGFFKECHANFIDGNRQLTFTDPVFACWVRTHDDIEDGAKLHRNIADWLLKQKNILPAKLHPFLAFHLQQAGDTIAAFNIWLDQYKDAYMHCETLSALQSLSKAINSASNNADLRESLAECLILRADLLRNLGMLDKAVADYEQILNTEVSLEYNQRATLGKGGLEHQNGNFKQALETYRRALDMVGSYYPLGRARAWRKMAITYMSMGQNSSAAISLTHCKEVLTSLKTDPEVLVELVQYYGTHGLLLYSMGRLAEALVEFEKGKEIVIQEDIAPLDSLILCSIYLVYCAKGELGKALELAQKAAELTDIAGMLENLIYHLIDLSNIYCSLGLYGKALMEIKRVLELSQKMDNKTAIASATMSLAIIQHDSGDYKASGESILSAISFYNDLDDRYHYIVAQIHLVRWYLEWDRLSDAVNLFERLPVLAQDEEILLFGYHMAMGSILMSKAEQEEDIQAREAILETARASFYRARWRASEQKSFMELLNVHISLIGLEVAFKSLPNAQRHIMIVEAMFRIMLDSLPDVKTKKSLQNSWAFKELERLKKLSEALPQVN